MKRLLYLFILLFLLGLSLSFVGCVTLPKESVQLSASLSGMIATARRSHLAVIDEYVAQRREIINLYMYEIWFPKFIKNFIKMANLQKDVCKNRDKGEAATNMRDFAMAAVARYMERRNKLIHALEEVERELKSKATEHYDRIALVNSTVTNYLQSAQKNAEFQNKLLKAVNIEPEKLTPFKEASKKLDNLFEEE